MLMNRHQIFRLNALNQAPNGLINPDHNIYVTSLSVFILAFVLSTVLVAVPGYFSHDELSILSYAKGDASNASVGFLQLTGGQFFRPLPWLILEKALSVGGGAPIVPHALLVTLNALVAVGAFLLIRAFDRKSAFLSAFIFSASPLAAFAIGWVAGIYDVLVSGFIVAALICAKRFMERPHSLSLLGFFIFTICAALSKETWVVLIIYTVFMIILNRRHIHSIYTMFILLSTLTILIAAYFLIRYSSLSQAAESGTGGYGVGFSWVSWNALAYFTYPLQYKTVEMVEVLQPYNLRFAYICGAFLLVVFSAAAFTKDVGFKISALSLIAIGVYLSPVLPIHKHENQYLYGATVGLSYFLARVVRSRNHLIKAMGVVVTGVLLAHTGNIQAEFYREGVCQTKILNNIGALSAFGISKQGSPLQVWANPSSPWWVLARLSVEDKRVTTVSDASVAEVQITPSCELVPIKPSTGR